MSVVSIIDSERSRYVGHFEQVVSQAVAEDPRCARELLILVNTDAMPLIYRHIRVDLARKGLDGKDNLSNIWLNPSPEFEATGFQLGPIRLEVYPFTWCSVQIAFDRPVPDMGRLEALLKKWLDLGEELSDGPTGSSNAIHSVTQIETNGELWYLTIDFGTAPADALFDLIDFLANEAMVDRIVITSHPE